MTAIELPPDKKRLLRFLEEIRVSPRPRKGESEAFQHADNLVKVAALGGIIVRTIRMLGVSGGDPNREARLEALRMAEAGEIDAVIVRSISRFSREEALLHVADVGALKRFGVLVYYAVDDDLDPTNELYTVMLALKAGQVAAERVTLKRETRRGILETRGAGTHWGRTPFGFRRVGMRKDKAEPKDAGIERDVDGDWPRALALFELRASGTPLRALSRLYSRDIAGIRWILRNPVYRSETAEDGLVPAATWDRVQELWGSVARSGDRAYIASGLVICQCGYKMAGRTVKNRMTYQCARPHISHTRRHVAQAGIIEMIADALSGAIVPNRQRAAVIDRLTGIDVSGIAAERTRAIAEIDRRTARVKNMVEGGVYSIPEGKRRLAELAGERDSMPPEPIPRARVRASLKVIDSLPKAFRRAEAASGLRGSEPTVRAMNLLLRQVLTVRMQPDRTFRVVWRPPFDAILAVAANRPELVAV